MRVYLTKTDLQNPVAKELLALCIRIADDGQITLDEIKELRRWLRANESSEIESVRYLADIMHRITADKVIDRDELIELQMAIERVVPAAYRDPIVKARKNREKEKQARRREIREQEKLKEREERDKQRAEEIRLAKRLRHSFAKVAGVSFRNDDWTERQDVIDKCRAGEMLYFEHDAENRFSTFATKVLRAETNEQLGHVPEYLASHVLEQMEDGYGVIGYITAITGGYGDPPILGVNMLIVYFARDVSNEEYHAYVNQLLTKPN